MTPYTLREHGTAGSWTFYTVLVGDEKVGALIVPHATPEKVAQLATAKIEPWLASR